MPVAIKSVCVIGAGVSGLMSVKACLEEGLNPYCYETAQDVGGIWNTEERLRIGRRPRLYPALVTNISKIGSSFSDFPSPEDWPPYIGRKRTLEYFRMYANHFDLRRHISFNTEVIKVSESSSYEVTGSWMVTTKNVITGETETREFDAVIAATSQWTRQVHPQIPGLLDVFSGEVIHSGDYAGVEELHDKSVLVIGGAISGTDIACDCSSVAKDVLISARNGIWVLPKILQNGIPQDLHASRFSRFLGSYLPAWVNETLLVRFLENRLNHRLCGLRGKFGPTHPFSTVAISDELPSKIYSGHVKPRPGVKCFSGPNEVTFVDGQRDHVDVVILATGNRPSYPFLSKGIFPENLSEARLFRWIFPFLLTHPSTLTFPGIMPKGAGPMISSMELATRYIARVMSGKLKLPSKSEMQDRWTKERQSMLKKSGGIFMHKGKPQHDALAREMGLIPSFFGLLFTDPRLFMKFFFGPIVPYHFRLIGEHKWDRAREMSLRVPDICFSGISNTQY